MERSIAAGSASPQALALTGFGSYPNLELRRDRGFPEEDFTSMLQMTDKAVSKVRELLASENKVGYGLRVAVQGGGCSGFQYGLTFENQQQPNDQVLEFGELKVYVDA